MACFRWALQHQHKLSRQYSIFDVEGVELVVRMVSEWKSGSLMMGAGRDLGLSSGESPDLVSCCAECLAYILESVVSAFPLRHCTFGKRAGHMAWRREEVVVHGSNCDQDLGIRSYIARIDMRSSGCRVEGFRS